jgi:anti-anti-sigma regulatory factor
MLRLPDISPDNVLAFQNRRNNIMVKVQSAKSADGNTVTEETHIIKVNNDMVGLTATGLEAGFLNETANLKNSSVLLDLNEVGKIDSSGIALCIGLKKECIKKGLKLIIEADSEISKLFKMLKIIENVTISKAGAL